MIFKIFNFEVESNIMIIMNFYSEFQRLLQRTTYYQILCLLQ
jgi:hypothetical protein